MKEPELRLGEQRGLLAPSVMDEDPSILYLSILSLNKHFHRAYHMANAVLTL